MLLIQPQDIKGNQPSLEQGRNRLKFVHLRVHQQCIRIVPALNDQKGTVGFKIRGRERALPKHRESVEAQDGHKHEKG